MAANRQTRALAFAELAAMGRGPAADGVNVHFRTAHCSHLLRGAYDTGCSLHLARRALYQFSFIGLNDARCASERLLEAQFGLRFNRSRTTLGGRSSADGGKGAHRVAKLSFSELSADDRRRVRWLNRDDLLLYAEASQLFQRRLRAYGIPEDVRCS